MHPQTIILIVMGVFFLFVIGWFIYLPYYHKKWRDYAEATDTFYQLDPINKEEPLQRMVGKLVKKVIDKPPVYRNPGFLSRRSGIDPIFKKKDYFWKYYLTFETFHGYKSFTVTKAEYHKYQTKSYGYIYFQDTRFSHFEIRNREELGIDEYLATHPS